MSDFLASHGIQILIVVLLIPSIILHEISHGLAACKLGDPTAKNAGRLSLNPARHVDPFGSVILPLVLAFAGGPVIGYAKPVPYNPRYFKNLKQGELIVGLAGPAANFVLACVGSLVCLLGTYIYPANAQVGYCVYFVAFYFSYINLVLMFFNLIPLPPLDGSAIISLFLPNKAMKTYYKVQQYALFVIIIVMIVVPSVSGVDPVGAYLDVTAGNLINIIIPW